MVSFRVASGPIPEDASSLDEDLYFLLLGFIMRSIGSLGYPSCA